MTQRVAILGLGTMGTGMAKNLLRAGFPSQPITAPSAKAEPLAAAGARIAEHAGRCRARCRSDYQHAVG